MPVKLRTVLITLLLSLSVLAAGAPTADVSALAWLAGDWQMKAGPTLIEEHWTAPAGGTMIGMSRVVKGDQTLFFEFLRIESRADGLYYVAQPKGRPGTEFKAAEVSADRVVFSNPQHDFPKRIIYRRNSDGSLTARIEGDGTEKEKPQEFHYRPM